jgi:EcsC protein family
MRRSGQLLQMSPGGIWIHADCSTQAYNRKRPRRERDKNAHTTRRLLCGSNRLTMLREMAKLPNAASGSLIGRSVGAFMRFGVLRGLRSVEVKPDDFRQQLANKHGLWVPDFTRMRDVPIERLDAIAHALIRDAERIALAEGAGFGLGGAITLLPDTSFLTLITLRLIQRLCLLYGFETSTRGERIEMWKAAAAAAGIDYGKDLAEKQILEKLIPKIAQRLAVKIGVESAEKWAARLIPLASSAVGGTMNFAFVRGWGRRVQRHLRARHVAARPPVTPDNPVTQSDKIGGASNSRVVSRPLLVS